MNNDNKQPETLYCPIARTLCTNGIIAEYSNRCAFWGIEYRRNFPGDKWQKAKEVCLLVHFLERYH